MDTSTATNTHATCFFIPSYIHERLAEHSPDEKTKQASKLALEVAHQVRKEKHNILSLAAAGKPKPKPKGTGGLSRQIYDCGGKNVLPGKSVRPESAAATKDRQVNNCYNALGTTYEFYKKVFGRDSLDGTGLPLIGSVHFTPKVGVGYNNAFWDDTQMVFGDGDGTTFDFFTDSLDVCAHELTHGFVEHSSPLIYQGQSGALNESIADVFACMVEHWHKKQKASEANWVIGETIFTVSFKGDGLRKLTAEKAYQDDDVLDTDPQPKHMRDYVELGNGEDDDYGGVHINSGIPNHAFYLAATALGGYSWEKAGKVWYEAMISGKIPQDCTFLKFAQTTIEIAEKVFPSDTSVGAAVKKAWEGVGVLA